MIAFPLRRVPCDAPTTPAEHAAGRLVAFHGSVEAALDAHDAWESSSLAKQNPGEKDRPFPCRADVRAALIAFKESNP